MLGEALARPDEQTALFGGFDHNMVLSGKHAAELSSPETGIVMDVYTTLPGMQLYTANGFSEGVCANGGVPLQAHHALCLETQFFPDSPHHANFPSAVLHPGEVYRHTTTYKFEVRK